MMPKEEAIDLVTKIYYKIPTADDDNESAKEVALLFCKRHIEELESLPKDLMVEMNIQYWLDVAKEIEAL